MLTSSRDIIKRLEQGDWQHVRTSGSHHVFKSVATGATIVVPHPKKDLKPGLVSRIYRDAGWPKD